MYLLEKGNFVINLFILITLHSIEDENSTWAKYFLLGINLNLQNSIMKAIALKCLLFSRRILCFQLQ